MVRRDEAERRADDLVALAPSVAILEQSDREMQARGRRVYEMPVWKPGVPLPLLLELRRLEAEPCPSALQALADLGQALVHAEQRDEQLERWRGRISRHVLRWRASAR